MKRVFLQNNSGFKWHSTGDCYVKGYITDPKGKLYIGKDLVDYFKEIDSFVDFEERVKYASGAFSVVIKKEEELFVSVDTIRSFPLFYVRVKGSWMISDNPYYLAGFGQFKDANSIAFTEFLAAGYVTGDETLIEGVRQVQAGENIRFKTDDLVSKFYFSYRVARVADEEYAELRKVAGEVIENAFGRFVKSLDGRTVVVPLSGGFDSRLIATMLKHYNYKKVICFTYGRNSSTEVTISKAVAEKLGFQWHFIEYTEELIKDFVNDDTFKNYYLAGSNLTSMFYLQEYFAVKYLKEKKLIPADSIFAPGHSGDFLAGSQLNKHGNLSNQESDSKLVDRIFNIKYCYVRPNKGNAIILKERIARSLQEKFSREGDYAYSIQEDWDFKEKLAKFNFNSNSIYTFFGYEFRIPFWDQELVSFFKYLPLSAKLNKYLYDELIRAEYFESYDINFVRELQPKENEIRKLKVKTKLKRVLPENIKALFLDKKENLFYYEITRILRDDLLKRGIKSRVHSNSYNSLIIQWYLEELKEKYLNN
ncbi:MAG: asparagine synthase C-terminal domain-containing protein [Bacteroidales bacterium]|nr:asparagine synthase C-terminal domain-containing protein [Bacteroidales bacterium]MCF8406083.1 asparagine synthase C-terminal domain-containing protein [Bacteroidales bacterium]